jgi:hypothetical protein
MRCSKLRKDGQRCERAVLVADPICWQHVEHWKNRLNSLVKNPMLLFMIGVLSLVGTFGNRWMTINQQTPVSNANYAKPAPIAQNSAPTIWNIQNGAAQTLLNPNFGSTQLSINASTGFTNQTDAVSEKLVTSDSVNIFAPYGTAAATAFSSAPR